MNPRFRWARQRVGLLYNGGSGHSQARGKAYRLSIMLKALEAQVPEVRQIAGDLGAQLEALDELDPTVIVAIGGDGTLNAAANEAMKRDIPLLVVPSGTMNMVAKDMNVPLHFKDQLAGIAQLTEARVDTAEVNGHLFLHSSLIGIVPRLTRVRESIRSKSNPADWLKAVVRFVKVAMHPKSERLTLHSDRGDAVRVTKSLAVSCNPLLGLEVGSHRRATMTSGVLGVYASTHQGFLAPGRLLASLASGQFRSDSDIDCGACEELRVSMDRPRVTVANDGELIHLDTPLRYTVRKLALRVLVPIPEQVGEAS